MSTDDVRDVINVSSVEVPDAKVLKMMKRAEVALELETGNEIDYSSCSDAEKEFITARAQAESNVGRLPVAFLMLVICIQFAEKIWG